MRSASLLALATVVAWTGCSISTAEQLRRCTWPATPSERQAQDRDKEPGKSGLTASFTSEEVEPGGRVIYGADARRDFYQLEARDRRLAAATAIVTYLRPDDRGDSHVVRGAGDWELVLQPYTHRGHPACKGEAFAEQHTGGWCTSFLVAGDIVATAGHCVDVTALGNMAFVFGFHQQGPSPDDVPQRYSDDQVYTARMLVAARNAGGDDYAFIRLDRPVPASVADPLTLRLGELAAGEQVSVVGYPAGLPVKVAKEPTAEVKQVTAKLYYANLDTFGGNSGSPVLDAEGRVIGILVSGARDYTLGPSRCFRSVQVSDLYGAQAGTISRSWEGISKPTQFAHLLPACAVAE